MTTLPASAPDYRFARDDGDAIARCLDQRGYAVARGVASPDLVRELEAEVWRAVDPARTLEPGGSRYAMDFIERAPALWRLLADRPYMDLWRRLLGGDDLVLHRSAAIIRLPGAPGMGWHSDMPVVVPDPPRQVDEVLNLTEAVFSGWLYLGGCHPERGGLAVIEGSHRADWPGPAGYRLVPAQRTFARGEADGLCRDLDVPGMVALRAEPGDLVLFSARTYHAALPHRGDQPRLACGIGFRRKRPALAVPWPLPVSARHFVEALPAALRPLVDGYTGIVDRW